MRRRDLVVWSSSGRYAVKAAQRSPGDPQATRGHPEHGRLLLALAAGAGTIRARRQLALGLSGGVLAAAGVMLSSAAVLIPGILVLLVTALLPPDPPARSARAAG